MTYAFNKFNSFVEAVAEKAHNLGSDSLKVALTSVAPVAGNAVLADLTEIAYTNLSTRALVQSGSAQSGGTYKLTITDLTLTASGGPSAAFRYVVIYNDTATNKELIGWYDRTALTTLLDGDQLVLDFDGAAGVLTIA